MTVTKTVDLGASPRAVAVTNNGDAVDSDEKAYVTIFYGQRITGLSPEVNDVGLEGHVVELDLGTGAVTATIALAPIQDTGFGPALADGGTGAIVKCSPNQLFNIAISP